MAAPLDTPVDALQNADAQSPLCEMRGQPEQATEAVDAAPSAVEITGSKSGDISADGIYLLSGTRSGRPLYRRVKDDSEPVFLYFWDADGDEDSAGWYVAGLPEKDKEDNGEYDEFWKTSKALPVEEVGDCGGHMKASALNEPLRNALMDLPTKMRQHLASCFKAAAGAKADVSILDLASDSIPDASTAKDDEEKQQNGSDENESCACIGDANKEPQNPRDTVADNMDSQQPEGEEEKEDEDEEEEEKDKYEEKGEEEGDARKGSETDLREAAPHADSVSGNDKNKAPIQKDDQGKVSKAGGEAADAKPCGEQSRDCSAGEAEVDQDACPPQVPNSGLLPLDAAVAPFRFVVVASVEGGAGSATHFELRPGEVVRVGRGSKNQVVLPSLSVSNRHIEFGLIHGTSATSSQLGIRDLSSNGTGVGEAAGRPLRRLVHNVWTPVQDGSIIVLPMRSKAETEPASRDRTCLALHFGSSPTLAALSEPPMGPGNAALAHEQPKAQSEDAVRNESPEPQSKKGKKEKEVKKEKIKRKKMCRGRSKSTVKKKERKQSSNNSEAESSAGKVSDSSRATRKKASKRKAASHSSGSPRQKRSTSRRKKREASSSSPRRKKKSPSKSRSRRRSRSGRRWRQRSASRRKRDRSKRRRSRSRRRCGWPVQLMIGDHERNYR